MAEGDASGWGCAETRPTFFFLHVMKTGGTTFAQLLEENFGPEERYPDAPRGPKRRRQYTMIDEVRSVDATRRRGIRVYAGHFPFIVAELAGADVTLTMLRDPIERTVSVLRHFQRYADEHRESSLEAVYEDPWVFPLYIHDYQAKMFAMTASDKLESHLDVIEIDDDRLAIAKAAVARVDVLGLSDRQDAFTETLHRRFGWRVPPVPDLNISPGDTDVPRAFRRRIETDNARDIEFFEHASALYRERMGV